MISSHIKGDACMKNSRKLKERAPRNRTLTLTDAERARLLPQIITEVPLSRVSVPITGTILGDYRNWVQILPLAHVDLLFLDPPYNLTKSFNGKKFSHRSIDDYTDWLDDVISSLKPLLKPTATIYICGDWLTSHSIFQAASNHFIVRNRITWEREKGRGAQADWKNSSEDIFFCTMSDIYTFNVNAVKIRRKVLAPYTDSNGQPKDWVRNSAGNFRDTHPSNIWTDVTVPFWSMSENTDHPTQKSEKLLAKLILASTNPCQFVLDPFLGSGTTSVVAKKLKRRFLGIEIDEQYCLLAARRLEIAGTDTAIQGISGGVFWERNSLPIRQLVPKNGESLRMF